MNFGQLNGVCWGAVGLLWILGAIYNFLKSPRTESRRARYDWLILSGLAVAVLHFAPHLTNFSLFHIFWLEIVGAFLLIAATFYTLWARWVLGTMWASHAVVREGHRLVTTGPYKITRHPIYSGLLGMILGSALSLGQGMAVLSFVAVLLFFLIRIRHEEQLMIMTFGDQYAEYQKRVPALIPGVKPSFKT